MKIADVLLCDFDAELNNTRRILERVPDEKADWKPHEKSMTLGRLATHVAELGWFGHTIVTTDDFDLMTFKMPDQKFRGKDGLIKDLTESTTALREAVAAKSDEELTALWTLRRGEQKIVALPKYICFRTMFLNHWVHHRAQLGVYLRLLDIPLPALYGPSADEQPF